MLKGSALRVAQSSEERILHVGAPFGCGIISRSGFGMSIGEF
jgi:hypothetical protein